MPKVTEELLSAHPALRSALVVGHGRFNAAVILEPNEGFKSHQDSERLIDEVWVTVESSNKKAPSHGNLSRPYLMVASSDKPFLRTAKGQLASLGFDILTKLNRNAPAWSNYKKLCRRHRCPVRKCTDKPFRLGHENFCR